MKLCSVTFTMRAEGRSVTRLYFNSRRDGHRILEILREYLARTCRNLLTAEIYTAKNFIQFLTRIFPGYFPGCI
jgi:hypothetical protein